MNKTILLALALVVPKAIALDDQEAIIRSKSSKAKCIVGGLSACLVEQEDTYIVKRTEGLGFEVVNSEFTVTDVTNNFLFVNLLTNNTCSCGNQSLPQVSQIALTADIVFDCAFCKIPIIVGELIANTSAVFSSVCLSNKGIVINNITKQIRNVTTEGFTVDIILQVTTKTINDLVNFTDTFVPTLGYNFIAKKAK